MDKVLVILFGCSFLVWLFRRDLKIWWYTPYCIPCQRYTRYEAEHKEGYDWIDDQYTVEERYQCPQCGRICEMEDAFRWKF